MYPNQYQVKWALLLYFWRIVSEGVGTALIVAKLYGGTDVKPTFVLRR